MIVDRAEFGGGPVVAELGCCGIQRGSPSIRGIEGGMIPNGDGGVEMFPLLQQFAYALWVQPFIENSMYDYDVVIENVVNGIGKPLGSHAIVTENDAVNPRVQYQRINI